MPSMPWTRQEVGAAPASGKVPTGGDSMYVCVCPCPVCHWHGLLFLGTCPWSNLMAVLEQRNGADTELLVFAMTLINKVQEGGKVSL